MTLLYAASSMLVLNTTSCGPRHAFLKLRVKDSRVSFSNVSCPPLLPPVLFLFIFVSLLLFDSMVDMDKTDEAMRKFRDSADLYLQAHVHPEKDTDKKLNVFAANIYIKCNEFTKAGEIFLAEGEFSKAGECFRVVKRFDKAVHCFEKASI